MSRVERIITTKKTPGVRFRQARELLNLKQNECAETLGLEWYTLRDIESGKKKMTPEMAINMENLFSVNFRWLLTGQGPMFLAPADRVASESPEDEESSLAVSALREDILAQKIVLMLREVDEEDRREILAYAEKAKQAAEERARLVAAEAKIAELQEIVGKAAG